MKEITITIIGLILSFISVLIAFTTYKQKQKKSNKEDAKHEGQVLTDIKYIKSCVERLEESLIKTIDEYHKLDIRITKIEEKIRKDERK